MNNSAAHERTILIELVVSTVLVILNTVYRLPKSTSREVLIFLCRILLWLNIRHPQIKVMVSDKFRKKLNSHKMLAGNRKIFFCFAEYPFIFFNLSGI